MDADDRVLQVGFNVNDASILDHRHNPRGTGRAGPIAGRYRVDPDARVSAGPALIRTDLLERAGGIDRSAADPFGDLAARLRGAGIRTATLDEVVCILP
jgi:hypothetical protein